MPQVAWVLLGKYLAVVNFDRILRGQKTITYKELLGAVVARMLVNHGKDIQRNFEEVWLSVQKQQLPLFYSKEQLAAIAAAARTDIPSVYRISYTSRQLASKKAKIRQSVLKPNPRSEGTSSGLASLPTQIRGRGFRASPRPVVRKKRRKRSRKTGNGSAG